MIQQEISLDHEKEMVRHGRCSWRIVSFRKCSIPGSVDSLCRLKRENSKVDNDKNSPDNFNKSFYVILKSSLKLRYSGNITVLKN